MVLAPDARESLDAFCGGFFLIGYVCSHGVVGLQRVLGNWGGQHYAFKCAAAAQRHIHLSGCKRLSGIDDGMLEGESLALVDGDGPCQPQGILLKGALHLGHDFLGLRIEHIFGVLPLLHLHSLVSPVQTTRRLLAAA